MIAVTDDTPHSAPPTAGTLIGRYVVVSELGAGGMGVVFKAYDPELERAVAIKLVRLDSRADAQARTRLLREARAIAQLSHPNVISVHDVGQHGDEVFIAMELVKGQSLRQWLEPGDRSLDETVGVFTQVARGLNAAHTAGLVHRDIKPDNILVGDDSRVRVVDFGLARTVDAAQFDPDLESMDSSLAHTITQTGSVMGTPAYMSPEQYRGHPADARSDQYSFFVAFHEAVTGARQGSTTTRADLQQAPTDDAPSPQPALPPWLHELIQRGLMPDPDARHPSMADVLAVLDEDRSNTRWRLPLVASVGAIVAILAFVVVTNATRGDTNYGVADPCGNVELPVQQLWSADAKQRLARAFVRPGVAHAADTLRLVRVQLDGYTARLATARRVSCEATLVTKSQSAQTMDRQMQCLDRRLDEVRGFLRVFSDETPPLDRAVRIARDFGSIDQCTDSHVVDAFMPLPNNDAKRHAIARLQRQAVHAETLLSAGRYGPARTLASQLEAKAEALKYPPLVAKIRYVLATLLDRTGHHKQAQKLFQNAAMVASAAGNDYLVARCYIATLRVMSEGLGQIKDAVKLIPFVETAVSRVRGDTSLLRIQWAAGRGNLLYTLGDYKAAEVAFRQALTTATNSAHGPSLAVATMHANLAAIASELGHHTRAFKAFERALKIKRQLLGEEHPSIAITMMNLGQTLLRAGNVRAAQLHLTEALRRTRGALGPSHPRVASLVNLLGLTLHRRGKLADAYRYLTQALALHITSRGDEHPMTARVLNNLGTLEMTRNNMAAALDYHRKALAIRAKVLPKSHAKLLDSHANVAAVLARTGKLAAAVPHYKTALAGYRKAFGDDHLHVAYAAAGLGTCLVGLRKLSEGIAQLELAATIYERRANHSTGYATVQYTLAQSLHAAHKQRTRATALAKAARKVFAASGSAKHVAEIDRFLKGR